MILSNHSLIFVTFCDIFVTFLWHFCDIFVTFCDIFVTLLWHFSDFFQSILQGSTDVLPRLPERKGIGFQALPTETPSKRTKKTDQAKLLRTVSAFILGGHSNKTSHFFAYFRPPSSISVIWWHWLGLPPPSPALTWHFSVLF